MVQMVQMVQMLYLSGLNSLNKLTMPISTFGERVVNFYFNLDFEIDLPSGISLMNPYLEKETRRINKIFYQNYYDDNDKRIIILGINPGRYGGGVTGLSFTDPVLLEKDCGITNQYRKRGELSAEFVYETIHAFGGVEIFFSKFLLSAICPLGFIKDGKNYNYYDDKSLQNTVDPFIRETLVMQNDFGIDNSYCICLGEGKNFKYLDRINNELNLFKKIIPLPHPRFIMQYRRKRKNEFIQKYLDAYRK